MFLIITTRKPSFHVLLRTDHPYWHGFERKYANLSADIMPLSESLQDTIDRTVPLWETNIVPDLKAGRNVMIMAHRNSIKGILKHIDGISTDDLMQVCVVFVVDGAVCSCRRWCCWWRCWLLCKGSSNSRAGTEYSCSCSIDCLHSLRCICLVV